MSSTDIFKIKVTGKSGHGSMPHQAVDATLVASAIVMNLQSMVSREFSPMDSVVVSVGKFISGTASNIISKEAYLEGTTRYYSKEIGENIDKIIERIATNTAKAYRATAEVDYEFVLYQ